jgi:hypothetical protein
MPKSDLIPLAEYASRLGVTPRRARALFADGRIAGEVRNDPRGPTIYVSADHPDPRKQHGRPRKKQ